MPPVKEDALKQIGADLVNLVVAQAQELGEEVVDDLGAVAEYAGERAAHLATVVGEPGFDQALQAERDSLVIRSAVRAVDRADAFDARILAVAEQGLRIAGTALAVVI